MKDMSEGLQVTCFDEPEQKCLAMEHKPCPFCGDETVLVGADDYGGVFIFCANCVAQGPSVYADENEDLSHSEKEARAWELWDERAGEVE